MVITARDRRRGLVVLLADAFLMWAGFFMVIPLLSVHFVDNLGWTAGAIGLILGVRQLTQQGLTVVSGVVADRIGAKWLICVGMLVRSAGFAAMASADSFGFLLFTAVLAAIGGALFEAPKSAAIAALTTESNRAHYYALNGIVGGAGLTIGPFIGALLLDVGFETVAYVSALCYVLTFAITLIFLPAVKVATAGSPPLAGVALALRDRPFVGVNLLLMGYWFMSSQLSISLPLIATEIAGTSDAVSWVFGLNAGMAVALQYPAMRLFDKRLRPMITLVIGMAIMATGLASVGFVSQVPALLFAVAIFSAGQLLASPTQQTVTANLANPAALGSYFGVASISLAVGGSVGNFTGGSLYQLGERLDAELLPWLIFAAVGMGAAAGLFVLDRRLSGRRVRAGEHAVPAGQ
jgi:DHA1 family multidrug resistance protein-like MFS transporter